MQRHFIAALALLATAACAQPQTGKTAPKNRNLITADEIATVSGSDAYQVIEELRPAFLQSHGGVSPHNDAPPTALVYIDGVQAGGLSALHNITASGLFSIQYLDAMQATQRYGTVAGGGAILITTKH
jgi:hypothetical protein